MRTKTLALSTILSALGAASVVAQNNVYSLNAVGYINVSCPPGYSILTCPLIVGVDNSVSPGITNDLNVLFPGSNVNGCTVLTFNNGSSFGASEYSYGALSWSAGGYTQMMPGSAVFFLNPNAYGGANVNLTFVGTVPQGLLTNTLVQGYNLVGSIVPTSGDLSTNPIMANGAVGGFGPVGANSGDSILFFDTAVNYAGSPPYQYGYSGSGDTVSYYGGGSWYGGTGPNGDPVTTAVTQGFFYEAGSTGFNWIENFTINP